MRQFPNNHQILLVLAFTLLLGITVYTLELVPWLFGPSYQPTYLSASSESEQICAQGARYLDPKLLIHSIPSHPSSDGTSAHSPFPGDLPDRDAPAEEGVLGGTGFPKLIHQSWMDTNLPVKFSRWSDSLRLRHPDWAWVLWTDEDNANLISTRHPHLNASYWALRNNIQRADFVRNLYMWDFGGVYADLDMECLRPLDSLLSPPFSSDIISPTFPLPSSDLTSDHAIAYAGSMETLPHETHHSVPNAFLASSRRHHPFWLLPLSRVLTHLHAGADGGGVQSDNWSAAEAVTGPEALLRSVETYRSQRAEEDLAEVIHPSLKELWDRSEKRHEVVVFDSGVIYPFSWSTTEKTSRIHQACRAAPGYPFDPIRCQDACRAYERGARMITYWSHTWSQSGNSKDLEVVAVER